MRNELHVVDPVRRCRRTRGVRADDLLDAHRLRLCRRQLRRGPHEHDARERGRSARAPRAGSSRGRPGRHYDALLAPAPAGPRRRPARSRRPAAAARPSCRGARRTSRRRAPAMRSVGPAAARQIEQAREAVRPELEAPLGDGELDRRRKRRTHLPAAGRSAAAVTRCGSTATGRATVSGRWSEASAWTIVRAAALRSSFRPALPGMTTACLRTRRSDASWRAPVDAPGDLVELVLERRVVRLCGRRHVGAEKAHAEPAKAAQRHGSLALAERGRHGSAPVHRDLEPPRGQGPAVPARDERDRLVRHRARARLECPPRLHRRHPADLHSGDRDTFGKLRGRACEHERDQHGRERDDSDRDRGPLPEQPAPPRSCSCPPDCQREAQSSQRVSARSSRFPDWN